MKKRRGFTLLELMIVIAILVVVAGLASPALWAPWGQSRIEGAGHMVRAALGRARVKAIESATPYQFRFRPGTGEYEYGPAVEEEAEGGGSLRGADMMSIDSSDSASGDADDLEPEDLTVADQLPEGVWFVDPESADLELAGTVRLEESSGDSSPLDSTDTAEWSAPILFYPNGRSMSARIRLAGIDRHGVEVVLRGLTGTAKVGKSVRRKSEKHDLRDPAEERANEPLDEPRVEEPRQDENDE